MKKLTLKQHLHIFYIKWIKGECRNLCSLCEFYNECYDNIEF